MTGQIIIFLLSTIGFGNANSEREFNSGFEALHYEIELSNGLIPAIRIEQLNNKYPDNMKHELREHVGMTFSSIVESILAMRDTASGRPTGKRQHLP